MAEDKNKNSGTKKASSKNNNSPPRPKESAPSKEKAPSRNETPNQHVAIVLFSVAVLLLLLALIQGSSGWLVIHRIVKGLFGWSLLIIAPALCYVAIMVDKDETKQKIWNRSTYVIWATAFLSAFLETMFGGGRLQECNFGEAIKLLYEKGQTWSSGGVLSIIVYPLQLILGDVGSKITICLMLFMCVMFATKKSLSDLIDWVSAPFLRMHQAIQEARGDIPFEEDYEYEDYDDYDDEDLIEPSSELDEIPYFQNAPEPVEEPQPESEPVQDELLDVSFTREVPQSDPNSIDIPIDVPITSEPVVKSSKSVKNDTPVAQDEELDELIQKATAKPKKKTKKEEKQETVNQIEQEAKKTKSVSSDRPYQLPPIQFLNRGKSNANDPKTKSEIREKADILHDVLGSFNVEAKITDIARGPSVTRYEVQPAAGVKVSRVTSLANDIALNFAADGVRIEAPVPGKPAIGIEVPNETRDTVSLRELLESKEFMESKSKLTFGVGKDIAGNTIIGDIAKMPHMIIAGATGSGKSVCTNSIIMSILYHASPEEVRLILIDPKIVEFRVYDGIPHLLIPVVTDPKKAAGALGWAVQEMLKRYDIFAEHSVRNLEEYNQLCKRNKSLQKMPQILICIDELAELMMTASKEVEDSICRLAQLARAAGMHLIIATQRPTANIITGLIKANIPSRIALSVKSQIDSRVILDMSGAETLLGNGDMLYLPNGQPKPVRVQGCYVSTSEIEKVVKFIKSQSVSEYDEAIMEEVDKLTVTTSTDEKAQGNNSSDSEGNEDADLIEQAIEVVVYAGQASTSNLQRRLRLGYGRAARIMDELEKMGIIGAYEGAKPRRVLMTKEQLDERKLKKMKS